MSISRVAVSAIAVAGLLNVGAMAQATGGQKPDNSQSTSSGTNSSATESQQRSSSSAQQQQQKANQAPEGFVMVEERTVVLTANEPQNHFLRAQQLLDQKDAKAAAGEVRMAAAYLDMQASRGQGQADQQLTQSAEQLRQIAKQITQQKTSEQQQLKNAFAKANCALADHLQSLAQKEIQGGKSVMAGHDVNSAADSLAAAYVWTGKQPPQQVSSAIQSSQRLAEQLLAPENNAQAQQGSTADEAQTAGARQNAQNEQAGQAPQNAAQTIKDLGQAVQQATSSLEGSSSQQQQQTK